MAVPKFDELFNPVIQALHELGGSATVREIDERVGEILNLSEEDLNEIHRGSMTKLSYLCTWARNYLKRYGVVENSERGVWRLTTKGYGIQEVDKEEVKRAVRDVGRKNVAVGDLSFVGEDPDTTTSTWQENLISEMYNLSPAAFEKLSQRLLREAGFIEVEVTGRSGDGGIDGTGILQLNSFLSFRILFQCKRYKGSVSSQEIRNFRGAMDGRAQNGLFMTTGTFTRDARNEADRDGATPIDLIDGNLFAEKMKELGLGVIINGEEVEVDGNFFKEFM
jgi:restriction system protein